MARLIIREVAEQRGLNRNQLQIRSGVTLPLLYRYWDNDTVSVRLDMLEKIANALGVKPQELIISDVEAQSRGIPGTSSGPRAEDDNSGLLALARRTAAA